MLDDDLWLPGQGPLTMLQSGEVDMGHVTEEQRLSAGGVVIGGDSAGAIMTCNDQNQLKISHYICHEVSSYLETLCWVHSEGEQ